MALTQILVLVATFFSLAQGVTINTPAPMLTPPYPKCEQFKQAIAGDSCHSLATKGRIPLAEFLRLNPGLNGDAGCHSGNIVPGFWYCLKPLDGKTGNKDKPVGKNKPDKPAPAPPMKTATKAPPKKTKSPKTKTSKPAPVTTKTTTKTEWVDGWETCDFGDCYKSWVKVSTDSEAYLMERATRSCKSMTSSDTCKTAFNMDFPRDIVSGCDSCEKLTSACSCYDFGRFHTFTKWLE
ncbi:hypothetical protein ACRE_080980 [Hapsidospora chrysogenum ATCC 11550]|uniref:LysM domain-containing protein n=1 Tax=Hapsidospora chrysogenum (strain ATCC 11550 / CBS 779.69 / DSM 880 / IAM 14645 / JCM 23072 / IMI 49137) TaxID=857340 RepID=A0A086SVR3_HAPC1|nr:hypothetical protein ACRE_080980 [Hapsidospora chrysogenum ATCC 11550]